MPYISVTYTLTNGRIIDEVKLNQNFSDIINGLSDGTKNININDGIIKGELSTVSAILNGGSTIGKTLTVNGIGTLTGRLNVANDLTTDRIGFTSAETNVISSTCAIVPTKSLINLSSTIYEFASFASIEIDATNNKLDFKEGSGAEQTATITGGTYLPAALATEIETQLNATGALLWTCIYSAVNKVFVITCESTSSILWYSGTNKLVTIGKNIGFDVMSDDTSKKQWISDYQYQIRYGDELKTITATNLTEGCIVVLKYYVSLSNTITIKDGTGNINCGSDKTLSSSTNYLFLFDGTNFNLI